VVAEKHDLFNFIRNLNNYIRSRANPKPASWAMAYRILVASYKDEIYSLSFDPKSASLTAVTSVAVGQHPSWIDSYPGDSSLIFAVLEQSEGKVVSVKYDTDGKGTIVGEALSGGADPCSLSVTKYELFVANVSCHFIFFRTNLADHDISHSMYQEHSQPLRCHQTSLICQGPQPPIQRS
jgi:6-phosphogluconolactonase (cycloisomerase 2 family)